MKYFEVAEGRLGGNIITTPVSADGEWCGGSELTEDKDDVLLWYRVREEDEGGLVDIVYYAVDYHDGVSNADEVLEQIKADHPAGEWQNNDW